MPRVTFVNEHRTVEIEKGTLISEAAAELGIAVCRESFAGTGIGDYTVWVKGAPECLSPVGFLERLGGARGQKRLANRARVLADCEVTTQGGLANRLRSPRPVTTPDRPSQDPSARKREHDASGTAAFPYGHPSAVGKGNRPAHARGGVEEGDETDTKQTAAAAVAKAAAAGHVPAAAPSDEAPAAPAAKPDAAAEKAARIAEKKARQAALKARLAAGAPAEGAAPAAEAAAPAAADGAAAAAAANGAAPAAPAPEPASAEAKPEPDKSE